MKTKVIVVFILILAMLSNQFLVMSKAQVQLDPKVAISNQIEDGLARYMRLNKITIDSNHPIDKVFREFLRNNPEYQERFKEYVNLNKPESKMPMPPQGSVISESQILRTENHIINGTSVKFDYIQEKLSNGEKFTKVVAHTNCSGPDPYLYAHVSDLTFLGIKYGEDQTYGMWYGGNDALNVKNTFHNWCDNEGTWLAIAVGILTFALVTWATAPYPQGQRYAGSTSASLAGGGMVGTEVTHAKDVVDECYSAQYGLWVKLDNHYIYPQYVLFGGGHSRVDISAYYWPNNQWWSLWTPEFNYVTYIGQSFPNYYIPIELNSWLLSNSIHAWGNLLNWDANYQNWPIVPQLQTANTLSQVTLNAYDVSTQTNVYGVPVSINGNQESTTGSTVIVLPIENDVGIDQLINNGNELGLYDFEGYGSENPITIDLSSDALITANYVPAYLLTLTGWEYYYGSEVYPAAYVDGYYVGNAPTTIWVNEGYHYISFDTWYGPFYMPWYNQPLFDGSTWYWNGDPIPIYGNTQVTAFYDLGG